MNFLRLNDPLLAVLYEDDEIVAIDKPYGINSHTNDAKAGNLDLIHDGLIEIFEKQLGIKLHIVHRLDRTTTGVIIFAKSEDSRKRYADFFRSRQVKKTYWFITGARSTRDEFDVDQVITHKGKDLEARTQLRVLNRTAGFELWQARPLTGRNHQVRIHAEVAKLPLLGDEKYGGAAFPFLNLHNQRMEFPNGIALQSRPPKYFEDLALLKNRPLVQVLFEIDRRLRLFSSRIDQCVRLVHSKDFGYTVDRFGKALLVSCYKERWADGDNEIFSFVSDQLKLPVFVRMMLNRGKDPLNKSEFAIGAPEDQEKWNACEDDLRFEIRSNSGISFGLFLDQRLQRSWVRHHCKDLTVLNLFSYTCGFSAAAAVGGAKLVTSVDTNKNVLNWGRRNFEVNEQNPESHKFLCRDSLTYLDQCANKGEKFDLVICDPPSFSRGEKGVFKIELALEPLLTSCVKVLNKGGALLFSTNYENFFVDDIRKAILKVQKNLGIRELRIESIQSALDFELPERKPILKSFLIRTSLCS